MLSESLRIAFGKALRSPYILCWIGDVRNKFSVALIDSSRSVTITGPSALDELRKRAVTFYRVTNSGDNQKTFFPSKVQANAMVFMKINGFDRYDCIFFLVSSSSCCTFLLPNTSGRVVAVRIVMILLFPEDLN